VESAEYVSFVGLIKVWHYLGVKGPKMPQKWTEAWISEPNRQKLKLQQLQNYKVHQRQILTVSLDHQSTFVYGPICKKSNMADGSHLENWFCCNN